MRERSGLTVAQTEAAAWTVSGGSAGGLADGTPSDPNGLVAVGGPRAVGLLVAVAWQRSWPLLVWRLPAVPWLLDRLYEWVARNRRRFPGETPWCQANPERCEPLTDADG